MFGLILVISATLTLSNPAGVSLEHYSVLNFEQMVVEEAPTRAKLVTTFMSPIELPQPFPVTGTTEYLSPTTEIQSDNPDIIAQAQALVSGAHTQFEAVTVVHNWVMGHISYMSGFPSDAVTVYTVRVARCAGYSNLMAALLRATGIPSRVVNGCLAPYNWYVGPGGGWHTWVEVLFPESGWMAYEPQQPMFDTFHLYGFSKCEQDNTSVIVEDYSLWHLGHHLYLPYYVQ